MGHVGNGQARFMFRAAARASGQSGEESLILSRVRRIRVEGRTAPSSRGPSCFQGPFRRAVRASTRLLPQAAQHEECFRTIHPIALDGRRSRLASKAAEAYWRKAAALSKARTAAKTALAAAFILWGRLQRPSSPLRCSSRKIRCPSRHRSTLTRTCIEVVDCNVSDR